MVLALAACNREAPPRDGRPGAAVRLTQEVTPLRYDVTITPDAEAMSFRGSVKIAVEVAGEPRRITLNAADLAFDRARLMDAVLRAAPRCIVVFGRAPARVLLSTELPLAELRGRVHRLGGTPVVVSYAIPYLLRQPADKARAWEDLCLATRASETTG